MHVFSLCANAFLLLDFLYINTYKREGERVRVSALSAREESGKRRDDRRDASADFFFFFFLFFFDDEEEDDDDEEEKASPA